MENVRTMTREMTLAQAKMLSEALTQYLDNGDPEDPNNVGDPTADELAKRALAKEMLAEADAMIAAQAEAPEPEEAPAFAP